MLVEIQRKLNEKPNVFCLAITFNSYWSKILKLSDGIKSLDPIEFQYALNIVARIISMNYHISLYDTAELLFNSLGKFKFHYSTSSNLIHECVKYIIRQYRARGEEIDHFVLLVDESLVIQTELESSGNKDIHQELRRNLLSEIMTMDDGRPLKVDLVMSG